MSDIQTHLKETHPKLSLKTIDNYINNWKRVETHLKDQFNKSIEEDVEWNGKESSNAIIKKFVMDKPMATRHQYLWSMKTVNPNILDDTMKNWIDSQIESGKKVDSVTKPLFFKNFLLELPTTLPLILDYFISASKVTKALIDKKIFNFKFSISNSVFWPFERPLACYVLVVFCRCFRCAF